MALDLVNIERIKRLLIVGGLIATGASIVGFVWGFYKIYNDTKDVCPPSGSMRDMCMEAYFSPEGPGHFVGQVMLPLNILFIAGIVSLGIWFILWLKDKIISTTGRRVAKHQAGVFNLSAGTVNQQMPLGAPKVPIGQPAKVIFCPECGSKNEDSQSFCNDCGSSLT